MKYLLATVAVLALTIAAAAGLPPPSGSQLKWEHKTLVGIYIHVGRGMIAHH
jgi:hypothetical protein